METGSEIEGVVVVVRWIPVPYFFIFAARDRHACCVTSLGSPAKATTMTMMVRKQGRREEDDEKSLMVRNKHEQAVFPAELWPPCTEMPQKTPELRVVRESPMQVHR